MTHDFRALRAAFGWFATGVAVVTANDPAKGPIGITVNSFSSVSLDPPLLLWCLDKQSDTASIFENCGVFNVNILGNGHREISADLAKPGDHSLSAIAIRMGANDCALIEEALAAFECDVYGCHDAGDHTIYIGRVTAFCAADKGQPLLYHRGGYLELA